MKKLLLTAMIVTAFLFSNETKAQVGLNLNVRLGARPNWGVQGNYAGNYYYLPEIDCYYDIASQQFIYPDGGNWMYASSLPYAYRNYDLYNGYKVVVNEPRPYLHGDYYRQRYSSYYNNAYRRPVMVAQRQGYADYHNDRMYNNRYDNRRVDEHFENRGRVEEHNDRNRDWNRDNRSRDYDHGLNPGRRG
jgi:hypothetical protein